MTNSYYDEYSLKWINELRLQKMFDFVKKKMDNTL